MNKIRESIQVPKGMMEIWIKINQLMKIKEDLEAMEKSYLDLKRIISQYIYKLNKTCMKILLMLE